MTSGGSGTGAVSFDAGGSTACSIASGKLHVDSGTGTCSITATKASDNNYKSTSSAASPVTINKADQEILEITAPAAATFGDADATIMTSGGSGTGAVSFDAGGSTACSIASGKLHVDSGTGTCSITATKASDNNYKSTSSAAFPVSIVKAQADCSSISGYSVAYDGNAHTATGVCKGIDGSALPGLDLSGTTHTSAGTYNVDPWTFATTADYQATSRSIVDKIAPKPASVSAVANTKVYGAADPALANDEQRLLGAIWVPARSPSPPAGPPARRSTAART